MDDKTKQQLHQQALVEHSLRQEFEQALPERVERWLQVKPHGIIPNEPFAGPSSECSLLFRDGHFYAYIALVQAVAEAIIRYMCDVNFKKHQKVFENNLEKLCTRGFIDEILKKSLLEIWSKRDDYHHLNPNLERDRQTLANLAKKKTRLLVEVESKIFAFGIGGDGGIVPKYPQYWKINDSRTEVFLRLEP